MRRQLAAALLGAALLTGGAQAVAEPPAARYVADEADVLSSETEQYIIDKNQSLFEDTGGEIVVVSVDFMDGMDAADYAMAVAESWGGIGDESLNNGFLLVYAVGENKVWAMAGSGIEDALPASKIEGWLEADFYGGYDAGEYDSATRAFFDDVYGWYESYYGTSAGTVVPSEPGRDFGYYPEPENDFVFAVVGQMGLFLLILLVVVVVCAADGWRSLALVLTAVGLGALGLLFLLNLVFSRWALRPVQQAWAQQQQFIADASHELKTPLTVILANNAILRQRGSDTIASQRQWIESTQMEAERMQSLVTDMLDLARPTPQGAQTSEGPAAVVDLSRLVEGEALTFEAVAFERDLTWQCTVAPGIAVRGNAARLQRAVAVLLDNACKYTDPGGTVAVTLRAATGDAVLSVRNSGEPIDAADLPHLFDRFYRADKARTHNAVDSENDGAGGYGLGLAIARDIAQAHKGAIAVTSTAQEGTTFTLRLPLV